MLRIVFTRDEVRNHFIGLTEMEVWAPWPQANDGIYEAEDGWMNHANIMESSSASGGSYVRQVYGESSFVEFTGVWADTAGEYNIHVYYANGESDATLSVCINNIYTTYATFPTIGYWGQFTPDNYITFSAPLLRGNNVLLFQNGINFVELDKITIELQPESSSRSQRLSFSIKVLLGIFAISFAFAKLK